MAQGGKEDDVVSSDGSVGSSPSKFSNEHPADILDTRLRSSSKVGKAGIPTSFADLFKDNNKTNDDSACTYVELPDTEVLEIDQSEVDKVNDLWGFNLLGCFAGHFPGLKAIHSMVDTWKT